ncbi:CSLREA domain-containing protein [Candidatus Binatia bacterium]|nr:CSLREA domain-containing protein [Candidatus Binatia bacterium]
MLARVTALALPLRTARVVLAALALLAAAPAAATQIAVTTTADEMTNDGDCSLREAFFAAISNAARDACPAGSNSATDEIVLAADATYSLSIPPAGNDNGVTGELVVLNGGATTDLKVSVAGSGAATISQEAASARVLFIANGASVQLEDVTLQGGNVTGTSVRGGGIAAGSGSKLGLTRCVVRENSAEDSGGGIRTSGELVIQDSTLSDNTTHKSGGAISTGSGAKLVVAGTLFANNVARGSVFSDGGAIESSEPMSITDSNFVNNVSSGTGGAIVHFDDVANLSSISQSCFVGNSADLTGNAVDVFDGSQTLAAAGNWWGADSGPSGEGSGSGDGVGPRAAFDPPQPQPHSGCLPLEMAANGGFQSDRDGNALPDRWTGTLLGNKDRRDCGTDGNCVFKMRGNGNLKRLQHVIQHAGSAGDAFTFRARSRAADVPTTGGAYRAILTIVHTDGSKQNLSLDFSTGKHGFERRSQQITASEGYSELRVAVEYGKFGGLVRFDSVGLQLTDVP